MKYLKTYESWMQPVTSVWNTKYNLDNYIKKYNPDFKWQDHPIWRGDWGSEKKVYVTTKEGMLPRRSANTQNYYTILFDNSPYLGDFPKRSMSAICSTEKYTAVDYGNVFRVIPFKDTRIGVCNAPDFWEAFPQVFDTLNITSMDGFNTVLNYAFKGLVNQNSHLSDRTQEEFYMDLNKLLKELQNLDEKKLYNYLRILYKYYGMNWEKMADLMSNNIKKLPKTLDGMYKLLDPKKNNLTSCNYEEYIKLQPEATEVWVEAGHILVEETLAHELEIKEKK